MGDGALDPVEKAARAAFVAARGGDRAAFGTVVRLYQDRLYNAVYRLTGDADDAAELTQEAFCKALEKLGEFRGESGPYTWLFRIAMNASVSRLRKGGRRRTVSLEAISSMSGGYSTAWGRGGSGAESGATADPRQAAETSEAHRAVTEALGRLDAEYRLLLVMRDLEGFDYKQMAELLELPLGTLKSRLFRARVALREQLLPYFEGRGE